jgi:prepilin-type N-terminal cleavage/methylation domain-containing protein
MIHPSKRRGFTLVELLVVLGIMIALAGLLFPVFSRARESAYRARCLNNLRQLTAAWLSYAADHERHMCSSFPHVGDPPPVGLTPGFYWGWIDLWPTPLQHGKLWPYLKNTSPFRCPDDRTDPASNPTSYAVNGLLAGPIGAPFTLLKLDDITQPSRTFVFIEQCAPTIQISSCFSTPIYPKNFLALGAWPGENHHGNKVPADGTGISFADGHATFWEYADPRTGSLMESTWGGVTTVDANGVKTYPGAYNPNSPDVYQLEAWSGGPVPPDVSQ